MASQSATETSTALKLTDSAAGLDAAFNAVVMFVALALVHWPAGFAEDGTGIELMVVMILGALALVVRGAGRFSVEEGLLGADQSLGLRTLARLT